MDRNEALRKLRKRFGKQFAYEINPNALTGEERERSLEAYKELVAAQEAASKALDERRRVVLLQDAEYQTLTAALKAANEAKKKGSVAYLRRFVVGTTNSLFFHVEAQGDSWEDIFEKLAKRDEKKLASVA